jgi:hypothetical protein
VVSGGTVNQAPKSAILTDSLGKLDAAAARSWLQGVGVPKPTVTDSKLTNIINDLYRAGQADPVGTGSATDAFRFTKLTGELVGGSDHVIKVQQYANALKNWLAKNPGASAADRAAATDVLGDILVALGAAAGDL